MNSFADRPCFRMSFTARSMTVRYARDSTTNSFRASSRSSSPPSGLFLGLFSGLISGPSPKPPAGLSSEPSSGSSSEPLPGLPLPVAASSRTASSAGPPAGSVANPSSLAFGGSNAIPPATSMSNVSPPFTTVPPMRPDFQTIAGTRRPPPLPRPSSGGRPPPNGPSPRHRRPKRHVMRSMAFFEKMPHVPPLLPVGRGLACVRAFPRRDRLAHAGFRKQPFDRRPVRFIPRRQHQRRSEPVKRFVPFEARPVRGDLDQDAARVPEIDGREII